MTALAASQQWCDASGRAVACGMAALTPNEMADPGKAPEDAGTPSWLSGRGRAFARFYPPPHITAVSWPGLREPQSTPRPAPLAARPSLVKRRSRYDPVAVSQEQGRAGGQAFARASFDLANPYDLYLDTSGGGRGIAWINGFCLGRYWPRGPQHRWSGNAPPS